MVVLIKVAMLDAVCLMRFGFMRREMSEELSRYSNV